MSGALEELLALSEAATPGEWSDRGDGAIEAPDQPDGWHAEAYRSEDSAFIVAAVNYVRALLAPRIVLNPRPTPSDGEGTDK